MFTDEQLNKIVEAIQGERAYPLSHAIYDIANSLHNEVAIAIRDGLHEIADAIRYHK